MTATDSRRARSGYGMRQQSIESLIGAGLGAQEFRPEGCDLTPEETRQGLDRLWAAILNEAEASTPSSFAF